MPGGGEAVCAHCCFGGGRAGFSSDCIFLLYGGLTPFYLVRRWHGVWIDLPAKS
ncbi:MAG: hypothetical protein NC112_08185 [Oxalobacter formigenes]|nr:hypothetical protein [Oxalobacter formigenes]